MCKKTSLAQIIKTRKYYKFICYQNADLLQFLNETKNQNISQWHSFKWKLNFTNHRNHQTTISHSVLNRFSCSTKNLKLEPKSPRLTLSIQPTHTNSLKNTEMIINIISSKWTWFTDHSHCPLCVVVVYSYYNAECNTCIAKKNMELKQIKKVEKVFWPRIAWKNLQGSNMVPAVQTQTCEQLQVERFKQIQT